MTFPEEALSIPVIYIKFFKKYMKEHLPERLHVDLKTYREILYLFNKKLVQALLKGAICNLPYGIGEIRIKKYPVKVDLASYNIQEKMKTGIDSKHFNFHSDMFRARFFWNKETCTLKGRYYYSFVPTNGNKRALAKVMKQEGGHKNFLE